MYEEKEIKERERMELEVVIVGEGNEGIEEEISLKKIKKEI